MPTYDHDATANMTPADTTGADTTPPEATAADVTPPDTTLALATPPEATPAFATPAALGQAAATDATPNATPAGAATSPSTSSARASVRRPTAPQSSPRPIPALGAATGAIATIGDDAPSASDTAAHPATGPTGTAATTTIEAPAPAPAPAARATGRDWAALGALVLAVFIICVDATVLDLAIPAISAALLPSGTQLLWIIDIYSFVVAGLLITMGTLGDRIGRRRLLLLGAAGFGAASVLAAFAPSAEVLIVARALLGIAGATLMPSTLGLIRTTFHDARQRSTAIGVWAAAAGAGTAAGPLVGGWLLEHFAWGSVFLVNVPIMALLLVTVPLVVRESRDPSPGRFDVPSAVLSVLGVVAVVFAVKESAAHGVRLEFVAAGVAGAALLWWFVRRQRRPQPMLDLGLFANARFSAGVAANALAAFAFAGVLFFGSQYLQTVLGFGPLAAGFLMLPGVAVSIVGSLAAASLAARLGAGAAMGISLLLGAAGALVLVWCGPTSTPWPFVVGYALVGVTAGVVTALASDLVVGTAPVTKASAASSVSEMGYELGISLGVAVLGSVVLGVYRAGLDASLLGPEGAAHAADTIGAAMHEAAALGGVEGAMVAASAGEAFTAGMHVAAIATAIVFAGTAVVAMRILRGARLGGGH